MPLYVCNRATTIDAKLVSAPSPEAAALKIAEMNPEDGRFIQVREVVDRSRKDFLPSYKRSPSEQPTAPALRLSARCRIPATSPTRRIADEI